MIADTAIVHPEAIIEDGVTIGPFSCIGKDVEIGAGTWIGPHVVINGPTRIGKENRIYQFASIGEDPQDKKYQGERTFLKIGDGNTFRECSTVSRGTVQGGGDTQIGDRNLFMNYVHIAHDCCIGNEVVFSNSAQLAGHVVVQDFVNLGGFVGVHQFCHIGRYAFCAGGSIIVKDVPPFMTVSGYPASVYGLNAEGLRRREFTKESMGLLKQAYKLLYRKGLSLEAAKAALQELLPSKEVQALTEFLELAHRGIVR